MTPPRPTAPPAFPFRRRLARAPGRAASLVLALVLVPGLAFPRHGADAADIVVVLGILGLFMAALWAGWSVLVAAPVLALPLAAMQEQMSVPAALAAGFAAPIGAFVAEFVLLFILGAIFGRAMASSGAAERLADAVTRNLGRAWAPVAVAAICALMTIGGVGVFVIAFAVYPVACEVHRRLGLRASLIPAGIALGAFTGTMTALPGAPSLTNVVASAQLGTTGFAAPAPGLFATAVMAVLGGLWLTWRARADAAGRACDPAPLGPVRLPLWRALLPIAVAIVVNALLSLPVARGWAAPATAEVLRAAAIPLALAAGIAATLVPVPAGAVRQVLNAGAAESCAPLAAAAVGVGFGAMLALTPAFAALPGAVAGATAPDHPAYAAAMGTLYSALAGSSSGGLYLALEGHGAEMIAAGAAPDAVHRFAALGSGVLDTLPHSGAVLALLAVCRERHATAYGDIFVVSVLVPAVALAATLALFA